MLASQQEFTDKAFSGAGVLLRDHVTEAHLPLDTLSDHGEVAVSDHFSNFVSVRDGGGWLVEVTVNCGGDGGSWKQRENKSSCSDKVTFWTQLIGHFIPVIVQ